MYQNGTRTHAEGPLEPLPWPHHGRGPSRPGTVTAASVLMWVHFAVLPCLLGAVAMAVLFRLSDVESGPLTGDEARAMLLIVLVVLLIPAVVLTLVGILAVKLLRGRRWARITTLVFNGVWIALGLLSAFASSLETFAQPLMLLAFEGSIAICLCTPSARAWCSPAHGETIDPLIVAWTDAND